MDKQSRPEHSELCKTLSVRTRCLACFKIYKKNHANGSIKQKKKPVFLPVHSDLCKNLPTRKRCESCFKSYKSNRSKESKKRKKVKKPNLAQTRSKTKNNSMYAGVLCNNCKYKTCNDLCKVCRTKYKSAIQATYRENIRQKNIYEEAKENMLVGDSLSIVQPINDLDLGLVQTANTCRDITNKLENIQAKSNQIQSNDSASVSKTVKYNCKQNNHINLPSNDNNSTASMKKNRE